MVARFTTELRERFDPLGHLRKITGYLILAMAGAVLLFADATLPTYVLTATFLVAGGTVLLRDKDSEEIVEGIVAIGADGIEVVEGTRTIFISWRDVDNLRVERRWFTVVTKRGAKIDFYVSEDASGCADAIAAERVRFAELGPVRSSPSCAKGDEDARAWSARLRGSRGDYRNEALSDEDLEAIASSPLAPADQRLGAILALGDAPEQTRARVRVAIDHTANHELAMALDAAFDDMLSDEMATRVLS